MPEPFEKLVPALHAGAWWCYFRTSEILISAELWWLWYSDSTQSWDCWKTRVQLGSWLLMNTSHDFLPNKDFQRSRFYQYLTRIIINRTLINLPINNLKSAVIYNNHMRGNAINISPCWIKDNIINRPKWSAMPISDILHIIWMLLIAV